MEENDINKRIQESLKTKELDLTGLRLSFSLPQEVLTIKYLKCISLYKNSLEIIPPEVFHFTLLEELNLYRNKLKNIPPAISELSNLKILNLGSNQLVTLDEGLFSLTKLEELDVSNNELSSISHKIGELKHLRDLKLFRNQLNSIPGEIGDLNQLRKIDISQNQIVNLPSRISLLRLQVLNVSENPLRSPPTDIVRKGRQAIIEYLKTQITDPSKCYAEGPGLEYALLGLSSTFTIYACTPEETRRTSGGDHFIVKITYDNDPENDNPNMNDELEVKNDVESPRSKNCFYATVTDNYDGTYAVGYIPERAGKCIIEIFLYKEPIKGSPFNINIEPDLRNELKLLKLKYSEALKKINELQNELNMSREEVKQLKLSMQLASEQYQREKESWEIERSENKSINHQDSNDDTINNQNSDEITNTNVDKEIEKPIEESNSNTQNHKIESSRPTLKSIGSDSYIDYKSPYHIKKSKDSTESTDTSQSENTIQDNKPDKRLPKDFIVHSNSDIRSNRSYTSPVRMTRTYSTPHHRKYDQYINHENNQEQNNPSIDTQTMSFKEKLAFWFSKAFTAKEKEKKPNKIKRVKEEKKKDGKKKKKSITIDLLKKKSKKEKEDYEENSNDQIQNEENNEESS